MRRLTLALLAGSLLIQPALAAPAGAKPAEAGEAAKAPEVDKIEASAVESAHPVTRSIPFRGGTLAYTVTPGTLTIRNDNGEATGSIFYVAYTVKPAPGSPPRPVSFLFNGGPGSSSMWLHLGSFGPLKIQMNGADHMPAPPIRLAPNPDTLLDKSDLVFIDAPTTGLSRSLGKTEPKAFFGVDADLDAFSRAIQRYLTVYGRWDSPKFLIGESYGTLRSAGLANLLDEKGVQLNGVALVSTTLNIGLLFQPNDQGYVGMMPTLAATAWYHNRLAHRPADLAAYLDEVRAFAAGPYAAALAKGHRIIAGERDQVAAKLAAYLGVSPQFVLENNLRVDADRFRKELLRSERKTVGRLDSRFVGEDADAGGEGTDYDPTDAAMTGAWVGTINDYLFRDLGFETKLTYRPNNYAGSQGDGGWNWRHRVGRFGGQLSADTSVDLADAMRRNPHLKVLNIAGYYDMATPFFGAEYDLTHMAIDPDRQANLSYKYYPSGHMVYIEPDSAKQLRLDIEAWMDGSR
jgi:carboxypeptidase C (cathepsin A)